MSGDSVPFALPLSHLATGTCEATTLYGELRKPLLRYLVCLGLSVDEAQDVVQEAFLSLHRHLTAGGSKENIRSWLFRVAHNRARNQQTRYDRRFGAPLDAEMDSPSNEATPEQAVLEKEKFERLGKAIGQLVDSERDCLLLRAGGLRYREIGQVLGMPTSTVAETIDRTIKKLAEKCDFSTKLIAWHDGELPDDEAAALKQHVRVCGECRNQLDAYQKVSGMVNAYCDAALASRARGSGMPNRAPVLGAAASIAVLLILFAHTRTERSAPTPSAVAAAATPAATAPAAGEKTMHLLVSREVHRHSVVVRTRPQDAQASRMPAEPAIQIAIPGEAIFPPGALPPGVDFVADVSVAADGSAQRLRLQPRLTGFEGGSNQ